MLTFVALLVVTSQAQAAQVPVITLRTPAKVLTTDFTRISGFYELPDGRVLVSDRGEEQVVVANFATGRSEPVGRKGSGPGEYRLPGALIAWTGDSVLLNDAGNTRLAVIGPDLRIRRSFTLNLPNVPTTLAPRAVDRWGRLYLQVPRWAAGTFGDKGDSTPIVRVTGGRPEVMTWVLLTADPGPRKFGLPYVPFTPQDGWSVTPDGGLVLVRSNDYHVEWWSDGNPPVRGAPVTVSRLPVTAADRVAYTRRFLENTFVGGRGGPNTTPSGLSNLPPEMLSEEQVNEMVRNNRFAEVKPPFTDVVPILGPDGMLWVERSVAVNQPSEWDLFDRRGRLVRRVRLPANRRLLGVGRAGTYLVSVDEDGFEHIERYE